MPLRRLARDALVTVSRSTTLAEVARLMDDRHVDVVVVTDRDRPVGLVSTHDIVVRGVARRFPADVRVDAVMTEEPVTLPASADRQEAVDALHERGPHLILVDGSRAVAVLSRDDLLVDPAGDRGRAGSNDPGRSTGS